MKGFESLEAADFEYAACYCEENVWRLLASEELADWNTSAVAVFGRRQSVAVYRQRKGRPGDGLVFWDYHVFALARSGAESFVLDFDTSLPFVAGAREYVEAAFPQGEGSASADPRYAPLFRVMLGPDYLSRLSSDRSHMRRPDGSWLVSPPPWDPPAGAADESWTLAAIRCPSETGPGLLVDREGFMKLLSSLC
jgi:protein N-terminal glutamine amidohydrolase